MKHAIRHIHFVGLCGAGMSGIAEVLFNLLQAKALRRGIFTSKHALVTAILNYIKKFNEEGRVFRWTKTADVILSSVNNLTAH